ncbi:MAG: hypothetical protein QM808_18065 [Steroidobacteraceae bacterium]
MAALVASLDEPAVARFVVFAGWPEDSLAEVIDDAVSDFSIFISLSLCVGLIVRSGTRPMF